MAEIPEEFWHNDEAVRAFQAGREAAAADIEKQAKILEAGGFFGAASDARELAKVARGDNQEERDRDG